MRVLVVGAGLIGTVYGAHLAAAGCTVSVLSHGPRTGDVAAGGLCARDVLSGRTAGAEAAVVPDASGEYDIVLVAVRRDQLASACAGLAVLGGNPAIVFFGNNPAGRAAIAGDLPGDVYLGFPGVGGVMTSGTADYVRIRQQPTALQQASDSRLAALESALSGRGFAVQRVADMDGWLAYHAAFVACIAAALYRCGTDPVRLAADRAALTLMCQAITGAFSACAPGARRGWRATSPCCTIRFSGRLRSATGHRPCAPRWASCALPRTAGTPRRRCGPWPTMWQPGSQTHPP